MKATIVIESDQLPTVRSVPTFHLAPTCMCIPNCFSYIVSRSKNIHNVCITSIYRLPRLCFHFVQTSFWIHRQVTLSCKSGLWNLCSSPLEVTVSLLAGLQVLYSLSHTLSSTKVNPLNTFLFHIIAKTNVSYNPRGVCLSSMKHSWKLVQTSKFTYTQVLHPTLFILHKTIAHCRS